MAIDLDAYGCDDLSDELTNSGEREYGRDIVGFSFGDLKKYAKAAIMPQEAAKLIASHVVPDKYKGKVLAALDPATALKAEALKHIPQKYRKYAAAALDPEQAATLAQRFGGDAARKALGPKYGKYAAALVNPEAAQALAIAKLPHGAKKYARAVSQATSPQEDDGGGDDSEDGPVSGDDGDTELVGLNFNVKGLAKLVKTVGPMIATIYPPAAPAIGIAMKVLAAADKGNPAAIAKITAIKQLATEGNPKAQEALTLFQAAQGVKQNLQATGLLTKAAEGDTSAQAKIAAIKAAKDTDPEAARSYEALQGAAKGAKIAEKMGSKVREYTIRAQVTEAA